MSPEVYDRISSNFNSHFMDPGKTSLLIINPLGPKLFANLHIYNILPPKEPEG